MMKESLSAQDSSTRCSVGLCADRLSLLVLCFTHQITGPGPRAGAAPRLLCVTLTQPSSRSP